MGSSLSSESTPLAGGDKATQTKRTYRTPDVREKDRFTAADNSAVTNTFEASVDKYDFLLIFRISEGANKIDKDNTDIQWKQISEIWAKCVNGSNRAKENSLNALKVKWRERFKFEPKEDDIIKYGAYLSLARSVIVDQLSLKAGFQLKISANNQYLFCRIRAPIKLLELQADAENYKLQFRGEIDPGSEEFWNREINRVVNEPDEVGTGFIKTVKRVQIEAEEDKKLYSRYEANLRLEKLYKLNKISATELGVSPNEETNLMLSRRVHALERIVDKVPIWNRYPPFAPFKKELHFRYLFQQYNSVRGKTLFRAKDKLYLTKSLLDKYYDFRQLEDNGIIKFLTLLHDANRGERITVDVLTKRWVTFWACSSTEVGSPLVTDLEYETDESIAWYWRPFSQPLVDIRDYFGEKICLYSAWLGHYTYFLLFPVLASFVVWILYTYAIGEPDPNSNSIDWIPVGMSIFIITWVVFYLETWKEQSKAISIKWGTCGFESVQKDRPQFYGEEKPDGTLNRSFIDNKIELYYPPEKRILRQIGSWIIITLFILFIVAANLLTFFLLKKVNMLNLMGTTMDTSDRQSMTSMQYLFFGILMPFFSYIFQYLSVILNDSENHQTDIEYEDAMISKSLVFQLFNNFTALFFVAFLKKPFFNDCIDDNCINDVREMLICIFILRYVMLTLEFLIPLFKSFADMNLDYISSVNTAVGDQQGMYEDPDLRHFVDEMYRYEYVGTFKDYGDTCIQFGYVTLFCSVVPLISSLALLENLIRMRLSAWKLCSFARRPFVELVEDVGLWSELMDTMGMLGTVVNVAVFVFSSNSFEKFPLPQKFLIFLAAEQTLLVYKSILSKMFSNPPEWLDQIEKRHDYLKDKFFLGADDDEEEIVVSKGNLDDPIDIDRLTLYDLRKEKISTETYEEIEEMEDKRRSSLRDLRAIKEQLQEAYKTETYNTITGIGENKFGVPLGRLSIKLLEIQQYLDPDRPKKGIKVRISFEYTGKRGSLPAGPAIGDYSFSKTVEISSQGIAVFDQNLGPFAPIRSLDADVVIDVIDARPEMNNAVVGKARVNLRELQEQNPVQKQLTVSIPKTEEEVDINAGPKYEYAKLFTVCHFQFSKVLPLRTKIYHIQDSLRTIEKRLAKLKIGDTETDDA